MHLAGVRRRGTGPPEAPWPSETSGRRVLGVTTACAATFLHPLRPSGAQKGPPFVSHRPRRPRADRSPAPDRPLVRMPAAPGMARPPRRTARLPPPEAEPAG